MTQTVLLLIIFVTVFLFVRTTRLRGSIRQYRSEELAGKLAENSTIILLDVRTRSEHDAQHMKGDVHIPLNELKGRLAELERHRRKEIVCYCQSGARSLNAAAVLRKEGFTVANLHGGIAEWNFYRLKQKG